jgi:hypothetical protein
MISLFVDADACPVKAECLRVAERYNVQTYIVSNGGIRPVRIPLVEYIFVANKIDEADKWIESRCDKNSVVATDDIPLSKKCIDIGSIVINFRGKILDKENIGAIEATRNLMTSLREANFKDTNSNKGMSNSDKALFLQSLDFLLSNQK